MRKARLRRRSPGISPGRRSNSSTDQRDGSAVLFICLPLRVRHARFPGGKKPGGKAYRLRAGFIHQMRYGIISYTVTHTITSGLKEVNKNMEMRRQPPMPQRQTAPGLNRQGTPQGAAPNMGGNMGSKLPNTQQNMGGYPMNRGGSNMGKQPSKAANYTGTNTGNMGAGMPNARQNMGTNPMNRGGSNMGKQPSKTANYTGSPGTNAGTGQNMGGYPMNRGGSNMGTNPMNRDGNRMGNWPSNSR